MYWCVAEDIGPVAIPAGGTLINPAGSTRWSPTPPMAGPGSKAGEKHRGKKKSQGGTEGPSQPRNSLDFYVLAGISMRDKLRASIFAAFKGATGKIPFPFVPSIFSSRLSAQQRSVVRMVSADGLFSVKAWKCPEKNGAQVVIP